MSFHSRKISRLFGKSLEHLEPVLCNLWDRRGGEEEEGDKKEQRRRKEVSKVESTTEIEDYRI